MKSLLLQIVIFLSVLFVLTAADNDINSAVKSPNFDKESYERSGCDEHDKYLKKLKIAYTAFYILCGVFFVLSFPFFCGFRARGVLRGSAAAETQSLLGNLDKGSAFSCFQFIGTTCLGTGLSVVLFISCGISSLIIYWAHRYSK